MRVKVGIFFFQVLQQSCLFLPLALGIYLCFSVLKIADLTVEGSFVTGASLFSKLTIENIPPTLCLIFALLGGALIGLLVSIIQRKDRIPPLIAGILMIFILSSINLLIMERPNINLLGRATPMQNAIEIFNFFPETFVTFAFIFSQSLLITFFLAYLLHSRLGLFFRAFGDNTSLLRRFGKTPEYYRIIALSLSNMLAAYCGVLTAQSSGYADVNMGYGFSLIGIGTVIIGQQLYCFIFSHKKINPIMQLFTCFLGVFCYFFLLNLFIRIHINPIYLKMIIGISLIIFLFTAKNEQHFEAKI